MPLVEVAGLLAADLAIGVALSFAAEMARRLTGERPALRHLAVPVLVAALFAARGRADILVLTEEDRWTRGALGLLAVFSAWAYVRLAPQRREQAWSLAVAGAALLGGTWFVVGNIHLRATLAHATATTLAITLEVVALALLLGLAWRSGGARTVRHASWAMASLPVALGFAAAMTPSGPRLDRRGQPTAAAPQAPSVVLLVMDTVRRDRLGLYGYGMPTSPTLDRLARDAVVFDRAYASSTYSLPSHASLLTGTLPSVHGARPAGEPGDVWVGGAPHHPLDARLPTLAERLAGRGYRMAGVVGNSVFLADWTGLSRGFHSYASTPLRGYGYVPFLRPLVVRSGILSVDRYPYSAHWPADRLVDVAAGWLREADGRPFFLFMNFMDAHAPYRWHGAPFGRDDAGRYDSSIRFVDGQIGRLLEVLRSVGRLDDTIVVVTADHGELFGEKGRTGHPAFLHEPMLRVPLLVKVPRGRGERVDGYVALHHVPGLIERARAGEPMSLAMPEEPVLLAENWRRDREAGRVVHERAVYAGGLKLLVRGDRPYRLFDLAGDPGEERDLLPRTADVEAVTTAMMAAAGLDAPSAGRARGPAALDPETVERLRSLGYGGGR